MKKKMKDHVDVKHTNTDKSTENKENTVRPDSGNADDQEKALPDGSAEETPANQQEDSVSPDKVVQEVRAVEEKLAEMQDKYIRLSAEFDNYRKRTLREKMDITKYAGENLLLGIIPLMDDFERALKHLDNSTECSALRDGINIIYGKFADFLRQNGVKEIETADCSFNVDLHDAVARVPVEDPEKKGKVVDVVQKGYYLQDKVLRFAKVVVGE